MARIALYSHDTMGLGHVRRNVLIARALADAGLGGATLLVCGAREAGALALPPGVDVLTLPALRKEAGGQYDARHLGVSLDEIIHMRAGTIDAVLAAFKPDLLIVDNVPRGACGELDPALASLRRRGQTTCVLGLRDVLDAPDAVRREWAAAGHASFIERHFDAVWIYGDGRIFDQVAEYGYGRALAERVRYVGYLDRRPAFARDGIRPDVIPEGRFVVCTVGGGQDGYALADAFAAAPAAVGLTRLLVTGPFMPADQRQALHRRAARTDDLLVREFVTEPTYLLEHADAVVCMGGYNTVNEVLAFGKRALVVPRVAPRQEQLVRAERLRDLGLVDLLHPSALSPQAIGDWLARDRPPPTPRMRPDLGGLARLTRLAGELVGPTSRVSHRIRGAHVC
jgi:predicted glycosyltransferase